MIPLSASDRYLRKLGFDLLSEYYEIFLRAGFDQSYPVLELASGSGRAGAVITRLGYDLIACDISGEARERHRERIGPDLLGKAAYLTLDMELLPFADNSIQSIACINTLHELDNPLRCLNEMIRVISPGGLLAVTDFNDLGFEVISKVHQYSYGTPHGEGNLKMTAAAEIVLEMFEQVEIFETDLNKTCICKIKRSG